MAYAAVLPAGPADALPPAKAAVRAAAFFRPVLLAHQAVAVGRGREAANATWAIPARPAYPRSPADFLAKSQIYKKSAEKTF